MIPAGYGAALLMVVVPLSDTLVSVFPIRLDQVQWRFGAIGVATNALLIPLVGLGLAIHVALTARHRHVLRTLSVIAALGLVVLMVTAVGFVLDALQLRASVRPEARSGFHVASVQAFLKLGLSACVACLLAMGGWRASRPSRTMPLSGPDIVFRAE